MTEIVPKKLPLHVLLVIQFAAQIIGLVGLVGYFSYRSEQKTIEQLVQQLMVETGDRITLKLGHFLQQAHRINQVHISALESGAISLNNLEQLHRYLIQQLPQFPEATTFLFGTPQGEFRFIHRVSSQEFEDGVTRLASDDLPFEAGTSEPSDPAQINVYSIDRVGNLIERVEVTQNTDVRARPWYQLAARTGQPGWSRPFQVGASNVLALNAYTPFFDDAQQLQGVFAANISLSQLDTFLETFRVGKMGQVFIVDEAGYLIASSTGEPLYTTTVDAYDSSVTTPGGQFTRLVASKSADPLMRAASQVIADSKTCTSTQDDSLPFLTMKVAGDRHFVRAIPYPNDYGLEWLIVTVAPESEFLGAIDTGIRRTLLLCGLALSGAIVSAIWVSRRITRSLSQLTQSTQNLAQGHPIQRFGYSHIQEVATLSASFQQMMAELQEAEQLRQTYAHDLERQVQEKTAALRQTTTRLREAQRIAHVGSWEMDIATGHVTWSDELFYIMGQSPDPEGTPQFDILDLLRPEDRASFAHAMEAAIAHGIPYELEHHITHLDGTMRYLVNRGEALCNEHDEVTMLVGTVADVSDRIQAEQASRFLASVVESTSDAIITNALDGTITSWNAAAVKLFGYAESEMVGQSVEILCPPDRIEEESQMIERLRRKERVDYFETIRLRKDGTPVAVAATISPLENDMGQVVGASKIVRDITERKQAEIAQLKAEQTRNELSILEQILDKVLAGYWDRDIPRNRKYLSPGLKRMFGYAEYELPNTFESWQRLILPEDLPIVQDCFERHVQSRGKIPYFNEVRYRHKDGSIVWVLCSGQVIVWDDDGNPVRMVGCHLDVSDRKQAEARLQEITQRLTLATDSANIGVWDLDVATGRLIWDACMYRVYGLEQASTDEVYDTWSSSVHPEDWPRVNAAFQAAIAGEKDLHTEFRVLWPDGSVRFIEAHALVSRDANGKAQHAIGVNWDITERKLAEQKIGEQAALLDITSDAIAVRDLEQRIVYWNQGAHRLYGWHETEAIGRIANELLQSDRATIDTIVQQVLTQGQWQGEIQKTTKTGEQVIVEGRWTLARDEAGQPKFILSVDTDITEKKQLETQFYLAQRLDSLGRLAGGIAHDLNNVLTPILSMAQLLRLTQPTLDHQGKKQLKLVEESAKRGASMVKQILTFTRGSSGEEIPINLAPLLREVANIAQQSFPKSIIINRQIPDDQDSNQCLSTVSADPTHLHQVFMNLCINARDAMSEGGVLTLSAKNEYIQKVTTEMHWGAEAGSYVVVTVADTGTGINFKVRDRIFEPFFTTKETGKGTGLGLSTVLGIVKNSGGFLDVLSEEGQGTQVKVYLPTIARAPLDVPKVDTQFDGQGKLVLIVDDDDAVRQSTRSLLESHAYQTIVTQDGIEAIAQYLHRQTEISLVILDVMMPNMGGIPLIQQLKTINPDVKIVAISGLATNRELALNAGASAFLAKPYSFEKLLKELQVLTA